MNQSPEYIHSELPAIQLFQKLDYQYLNGSQADERADNTEVLLKTRLKAAIQRLNPWISPANAEKAYDKITRVNGASLMDINQQIWALLRGDTFTVKQVIDGKEDFHAVRYIDYRAGQMANNDFLVVNQMRYRNRIGRQSIPDLVVYVNGLPIAVLECKSPTAATAWDSAYNDLTEYQDLNPKLFYYNQLCVGLWGVGGRYGAINSPQKFYSVFRTLKGQPTAFLGKNPTAQAELIYALFQKESLLSLIHI